LAEQALSTGSPVRVTESSALPSTKASVYDKLDRYLLNPDHPVGRSKANWFDSALGFNRSNASELAEQIAFDEGAAVQTATIEQGVKFNQVISVTGANGKVIDVTFGWIRNTDGIVRLTTAIPAKK
jgi:filamentous hemagglutinin